jgi:NDP-sugar pyrophosphorylase family protein
MLPVVEVPMIERVVAHLAGHGIDSAVLSMGYRPDAFLTAFPQGACAGVSLQYAVEPAPLDTAGAIAYAARDAGVDETFLVVNGDVLSDLDVSELIAFHRDRGAEGTISLSPVEDPSTFGVVPTTEEGSVLSFIEKPPPGTAPTNLVNAGYYVLEPSVLDRIPAGRRVNVERETFPAMVAEGTLYALASTAYWHDTGTPERFLQANAHLLHGARPGPPAPGAVECRPGVWTLGTAVADGQVEACSLLGDGAVVRAGASVTDSVVGAGARVEAGARVAGSVLFPGTTVASGAVVERSLLGEGVVVGADAKVVGLSVIGGGGVVEPGAALDGARR